MPWKKTVFQITNNVVLRVGTMRGATTNQITGNEITITDLDSGRSVNILNLDAAKDMVDKIARFVFINKLIKNFPHLTEQSAEEFYDSGMDFIDAVDFINDQMEQEAAENEEEE